MNNYWLSRRKYDQSSVRHTIELILDGYLNRGFTLATLTTVDIMIARAVERVQAAIKDGDWDVYAAVLQEKGWMESSCDQMRKHIAKIPPTEWRELKCTSA